MKTGIISFASMHGRHPWKIGSSMIRGQWLAEAWPDADLWSNGRKFDALIFQKAYWEQMMNDFTGPKILDLCDPDWMDGNLELIKVSKLVDAITCSNPGLTEFVSKVVKNIPVITVPDRLNMGYFTNPKKHIGRAKTVVWFGYSHNAKEVLPRVLSSLKQHGLDLLVVSNAGFNPINSFGVQIQNIEWSLERAYEDIKLGDIAINPKSVFGNYRYKSNNKTLISWGLGIPVAETADDMVKFLEPAGRQKEVDARRVELEKDWDIQLSVRQFEDILKTIWSARKNEKQS